MVRPLQFLCFAALLLTTVASQASAQPAETDWYDPSAEYVRVAVTEDGVYAVDRSSLEQAGLPPSADPSTFRLFENGSEVPIHLEPNGDVLFVGQRNRGEDELYAYNGVENFQSSDERSLYTDTTYYWLTWGGPDGIRYQSPTGTTPSVTRSTIRDTLHAEQDRTYYLGRPFEAEHPLYRDAEGYYWREFRHSDTNPLALETTLDVGRRVASASETLDLQIRLNSSSASCHRIEVFADLRSGGSTTRTSIGEVEWRGYSQEDIVAQIPQDQIPATGLRIRLESTNDVFSDPSCPDPSRNPNYVLFDYVEVVYTRSLASAGGRQHFSAPDAQATRFQLENLSGSDVTVLQPASSTRWSLSPSGGTASFDDTPPQPSSTYWVSEPSAYRSPDAVLPEATSSWSSLSNGADYVILTTSGLRESAERLADFRRTFNGFDVAVVKVQDVYDEFDYGRPTPIAVRRFVHHTQQWTGGAPRFLVIWGDAQYPIYTGGEIDERRPFWNVSSFGYSPSDTWFAMQYDGPNDWSEVLAVGRIPIRSNAQGDLFLDKIRSYENAPVADWQQRMLLLAGGTSELEQQRLQNASNGWGELATRRTTAMGDTLYPAGMDTLRYYKQINDALDTSFRDSLAVDLERGSGWLNYFGHSAALTWEIVTDPPAEFNNAGRLPFVVSLGCRTGSFAGGRFEVKSLPSLGEQLVVGTVDENGNPRGGGLNGGIAHWGTSALGNLSPSATLNDALVDRVFQDTMRVLGEAIQVAKADVADSFGSSPTIIRHLLQYGLLGDPATRLAILDEPDLHVTRDRIRIRPSNPTPGERMTVDVEIANRGLVPGDSVDVVLTWERPDGTSSRIDRSIPRFAVRTTETYEFDLDETAIGSNTFRIDVDPMGEYDERLEDNNTASREQVVFDTGLDLISPIDAGVSTSSPTLRLGIVRQTQEPIPVQIQVDSVASFDSPGLQTTSQSAQSVKLEWTPPQDLQSNTTYWWRARVASDGDDNWKTSTFTVSASDADWLQRDRLFRANALDQVQRQNRSWTFDNYTVTVEQYSERGFGSSDYGFILNDTEQLAYLTFGFSVLVLDDVSGDVIAWDWFPTYDLRDDLEPASGDQQAAVDELRSFLDTHATEGRYVFVRTRHLARNSGPTISNEIVELFENLGSDPSPTPYSTTIGSQSYADVWVMRTRVGYPEETVEQVSPVSESSEVKEISLTADLDFPFPEGSTVTPV
ncbi:C25 family cysteine peptidase, partial [Longibacter sp.]|uniref:C25 family cysteine peptidase n=1 Tax=Longibacter sp. TaxID=2045415 RepID=UPI003EBE337E